VNAAEVSNIVVGLYHLRVEKLHDLCSILRLEIFKMLQEYFNDSRGDDWLAWMQKLNLFVGGLIGFVLPDRNLKLADCSSANVVDGPAQRKKNRQCHN
tara:strand:- start:838 stop:1131 length:294 start_codon:yes stop_codon:yes gene_type:complete